MTRSEVLEQYDIDAETGIIQSPGKFEAEMLYVPALWAVTMDGCGEELAWSDGVTQYIVDVDAELRAEYPEIAKGTSCIVLSESDSGFVSASEMTAEEFATLEVAYESGKAIVPVPATEGSMTDGLKEYQVNVRAIVTVGRKYSGLTGKNWPWEIYDHDGSIVRCDTLVTVRAKDRAAAIELAKDSAPLLRGIGYKVEDVELWVDEGIDVEEMGAQAG